MSDIYLFLLMGRYIVFSFFFVWLFLDIHCKKGFFRTFQLSFSFPPLALYFSVIITSGSYYLVVLDIKSLIKCIIIAYNKWGNPSSQTYEGVTHSYSHTLMRISLPSLIRQSQQAHLLTSLLQPISKWVLQMKALFTTFSC